MADQERAIIAMLEQIGITIAPRRHGESGWGWAIQNDKIIRNWQGPYATPSAAAEAGLSWLVEHARKGIVCDHLHPVPIDDDPMAPWLRFFETNDIYVD
ncbi:MAG TPA: hypothetical protein VKE41_13175 [Roseiflexaceae bacterium]|nr:hypothetical protein [Roseiflexaceae bacterium]